MGFIRNINVIHKIVLVSALMFSFYASQASAVWISVSNNSDLPLIFYSGQNHGSAFSGSIMMPAHESKNLFAFDIGINNGTATFAVVSSAAATPAKRGQYNIPALRFFLYVTPTARQAASNSALEWTSKIVGGVVGAGAAIGSTIGTDGAVGYGAAPIGATVGGAAGYDAQKIGEDIVGSGGMHHVIGTYAVQVLNAPPGVKVGVYYGGGKHVTVCISNQNGQFYQFCPNPQSVWPDAFISDSDYGV